MDVFPPFKVGGKFDGGIKNGLLQAICLGYHLLALGASHPFFFFFLRKLGNHLDSKLSIILGCNSELK